MSEDLPMAEAVPDPLLGLTVTALKDREVTSFYVALAELGLGDRIAVGFSVINNETASGLVELIQITRQRERELNLMGRNRIQMTREPDVEYLMGMKDTHSVLAIRGETDLVNKVWKKAAAIMNNPDDDQARMP